MRPGAPAPAACPWHLGRAGAASRRVAMQWGECRHEDRGLDRRDPRIGGGRARGARAQRIARFRPRGSRGALRRTTVEVRGGRRHPHPLSRRGQRPAAGDAARFARQPAPVGRLGARARRPLSHRAHGPRGARPQRPGRSQRHDGRATAGAGRRPADATRREALRAGRYVLGLDRRGALCGRASGQGRETGALDRAAAPAGAVEGRCVRALRVLVPREGDGHHRDQRLLARLPHQHLRRPREDQRRAGGALPGAEQPAGSRA